MKLAKPLTTTLGAVALTLVATGSALAVNIGILSQSSDPVATIDALSAAPAVSQVDPQFVYVDLTDLSQAPETVTQTTQPQVTSTPATSFVENEYEGAEYDD